MGTARWDPSAWSAYASAAAATPRDARFKSRGLVRELDPSGVKVRESRDSALNPLSTAIIVCLDVTGSMGRIADAMSKDGLGTLFTEILDRRPVSDPHLMFMGIGDVTCDRAPLQVSQFEADIRIVEQLNALFLEGGGGGNTNESYTLPWYFAAEHTAIDCHEKRGKKGYLFTVGDEECPPTLSGSQIEAVLGINPERDFTAEALLTMAARKYHVFHVIVKEGSYARTRLPEVQASWRGVLGQNVLELDDHTKLAEVVVSAIEVHEGRPASTVAESWKDKGTALVVANAVRTIVPAGHAAGGILRF
jgi:hypothetical protein